MDISFKVGDEKFNCRVSAVIISDQKILAIRHNQGIPYYSLPGGRVMLGETAEQAVVREVQEELGIPSKILRPLWFDQAFFTKNMENLRYHELCVYFLIDVSDARLLERGNAFTQKEGQLTHAFEWLEFDRLKNENFYPAFLKNEIYHLPNEFAIRIRSE